MRYFNIHCGESFNTHTFVIDRVLTEPSNISQSVIQY